MVMQASLDTADRRSDTPEASVEPDAWICSMNDGNSGAFPLTTPLRRRHTSARFSHSALVSGSTFFRSRKRASMSASEPTCCGSIAVIDAANSSGSTPPDTAADDPRDLPLPPGRPTCPADRRGAFGLEGAPPPLASWAIATVSRRSSRADILACGIPATREMSLFTRWPTCRYTSHSADAAASRTPSSRSVTMLTIVRKCGEIWMARWPCLLTTRSKNRRQYCRTRGTRWERPPAIWSHTACGVDTSSTRYISSSIH
mmetsp:Transcript_20366/g.52877  ORF Transcript_20366/g.52877 Transcript_20366/m.52877 type:complete len:258 (-) Transcript_20366:435-1208(-)